MEIDFLISKREPLDLSSQEKWNHDNMLIMGVYYFMCYGFKLLLKFELSKAQQMDSIKDFFA